MSTFLTLWHASSHKLCLEFIWQKNKLLEVVVTFKSLSSIYFPVQFNALPKKAFRGCWECAGGDAAEEQFESRAASKRNSEIIA